MIERADTPGAVDGTGPVGGVDDPAGIDQTASRTANTEAVMARLPGEVPRCLSVGSVADTVARADRSAGEQRSDRRIDACDGAISEASSLRTKPSPLLFRWRGKSFEVVILRCVQRADLFAVERCRAPAQKRDLVPAVAQARQHGRRTSTCGVRMPPFTLHGVGDENPVAYLERGDSGGRQPSLTHRSRCATAAFIT